MFSRIAKSTSPERYTRMVVVREIVGTSRIRDREGGRLRPRCRVGMTQPDVGGIGHRTVLAGTVTKVPCVLVWSRTARHSPPNINAFTQDVISICRILGIARHSPHDEGITLCHTHPAPRKGEADEGMFSTRVSCIRKKIRTHDCRLGQYQCPNCRNWRQLPVGSRLFHW